MNTYYPNLHENHVTTAHPGGQSDPLMHAAVTDAASLHVVELSSRSPSKMSKNMGLHQIVRIRQMVVQWRRRAANNIDRTIQVMSPSRGRKLVRGSSSCGQSSTEQLPPAGYLAIYVGRERRRFEIRTEHINHPLLRGLLDRTEEEFGLNQEGGLAIPACEVVLFEHLLWMVENHELAHLYEDATELRELLDFYMHTGSTASTKSSCLREANFADTVPAGGMSAISAGYRRLHH